MSRIKTFHIDYAQLLLTILAVLMIVGVLPFTATVVGGLILLSVCQLRQTWTWR